MRAQRVRLSKQLRSQRVSSQSSLWQQNFVDLTIVGIKEKCLLAKILFDGLDQRSKSLQNGALLVRLVAGVITTAACPVRTNCNLILGLGRGYI
jgi:hypothetical protein